MPFRSYANSYNFAEKIISKFQRFYEMYACQNGKKVIKFGFWVQKKRLAKTNRPLTFATLDPALWKVHGGKSVLCSIITVWRAEYLFWILLCFRKLNVADAQLVALYCEGNLISWKKSCKTKCWTSNWRAKLHNQKANMLKKKITELTSKTAQPIRVPRIALLPAAMPIYSRSWIDSNARHIWMFAIKAAEILTARDQHIFYEALSISLLLMTAITRLETEIGNMWSFGKTVFCHQKKIYKFSHFGLWACIQRCAWKLSAAFIEAIQIPRKLKALHRSTLDQITRTWGSILLIFVNIIRFSLAIFALFFVSKLSNSKFTRNKISELKR